MVRRAETMTETATEARMRVFGLSEQDAKSAIAESVLGRLYMDGTLGIRSPLGKDGKHGKKGTAELRYDAGERYALDIARYYVLLGYQSSYFGRAQNILSVHGFDGDISEEKAEATRRSANQMMKLNMCLGQADTSGRPVATSVWLVCFEGVETARGWHVSQIRHLVRGLDALVEFYGIGATK